MWRWLTTRFSRRRVLLVMRLTDMLRVHPAMDTTHLCSKCGEPVGIYPSGQRVLQRYRRVEIVCNHCHELPITAYLAPGAEEESRQSIWRLRRTQKERQSERR